MKVDYTWQTGSFVLANEELLKECSELYSEHYGIWGAKGIRPGENVRLPVERLRQWFEDDSVSLYYARCEDKLVGYAIAFSKSEPSYGIVTWVTQLVVHKDYRHQGIAKSLLFTIWGFTNHYAWGIVSANPYAIRALEKATRRRAVPLRIKKNAIKLKNIGIKEVPFIDATTVFDVTGEHSLVNTQFFVDTSDTIQKIMDVTSDEVPWTLGDLREGWEWFAFTFKDQDPISLTKEEIEHMIKTSDSVVQKAYSRMELDENKQTWMQNTIDEVDYIDRVVDLKNVDLAYDLGCGSGRHAIELAKRGIQVVGIDYVEENIELLKERTRRLNLTNTQGVIGDCRTYRNDTKGALVICLYDVVGTYSTNSENQKILQTAYDLLKVGGYAVFSVMNYEMTLARAKYTFTFENEPDKLLSLPSSNIMESTGNIFNPEYYLVDTDTEVIYRKEQFISGKKLPGELMVKDKRFTLKEIVSMCETVGFSIVQTKYTNASGWDTEYSPEDENSKEILIICKKEERK